MVLLKDILHGNFDFPPFSLAQADSVASKDAERLFAGIAHLLTKSGVQPDDEVYPLWVPARVEVLGKHTDYAGGKSLLAALSKGFAFIAHKRQGPQLDILDAGSRERIEVDLRDPMITSSHSWGIYVQTVLDRVRGNFGSLIDGGTISMASNIPTAAGMSSSSALVTGLFLSLKAMYSFDSLPEYRGNIKGTLDLADYLGHVENGQSYRGLPGDKGVGTFGGSQDHTAILCSKKGVLRLFAFRPTRMLDEVKMPEGYSFVIGCSGVHAEKTRAARDKYNRCANLVAQILACDAINPGKMYASLGQIIEADGFDLQNVQRLLAYCGEEQVLFRRLYQFVEETKYIIPGVVKALREHDLPRIGALVDRSHELADTHLSNQVPETNYLVRSARSLGAVASSAFGAGFGGSVWALVEDDSATIFKEEWGKRYIQRFPQRQDRSTFFVDRTGHAAK